MNLFHQQHRHNGHIKWQNQVSKSIRVSEVIVAQKYVTRLIITFISCRTMTFLVHSTQKDFAKVVVFKREEWCCCYTYHKKWIRKWIQHRVTARIFICLPLYRKGHSQQSEMETFMPQSSWPRHVCKYSGKGGFILLLCSK